MLLVTLSGADRRLTGHDSTYFKVTGKRFFRQLSFGRIRLYDSLFSADEKGNLTKPPYLVIVDGHTSNFGTDQNLLTWFNSAVPNPDGATAGKYLNVQQIVIQINHLP